MSMPACRMTLIGSSKRWQEWMELERPEDEPLPGECRTEDVVDFR